MLIYSRGLSLLFIIKGIYIALSQLILRRVSRKDQNN